MCENRLFLIRDRKIIGDIKIIGDENILNYGDFHGKIKILLNAAGDR